MDGIFLHKFAQRTTLVISLTFMNLIGILNMLQKYSKYNKSRSIFDHSFKFNGITAHRLTSLSVTSTVLPEIWSVAHLLPFTEY